MNFAIQYVCCSLQFRPHRKCVTENPMRSPSLRINSQALDTVCTLRNSVVSELYWMITIFYFRYRLLVWDWRIFQNVTRCNVSPTKSRILAAAVSCNASPRHKYTTRLCRTLTTDKTEDGSRSTINTCRILAGQFQHHRTLHE